ncbi:hypothetical protein GJU40_11710 [Bacillus lacus]|uniref:DUF4878 domain-containing protein n=1 Tax=Metabacillus lacus TaxID=1983721 RepID=A0A7X2IZS1_9BACI|nr:hypothetical protein [Metabacillus lacus]MRX72812.1 hypothetical protein [Metabacillus lacus]
MRRRQRRQRIIVGMVVLLIIGAGLLLVKQMGGHSARDVVVKFYKEEQGGDFGSAWKLFHPKMQEKFQKNAYVTERSHIYMGHYGVSTFDFKIKDRKKLKNWRMSPDGQSFERVEKYTVQQEFHSKFGVFTIVQEVFTVKEKGQWRILWEFRQ